MGHDALAGLPAQVYALAPELAVLDLPLETRATCSHCAVGAPRDERTVDRPFDIDIRCCSFHPNHPNWLVGRALRRGGIGARKIRERMHDRDGISSLGLAPSKAVRERYARDSRRGFGRDPELLCPYFTGGDLACSVWQDRGAVCRTWHCLYTDGARGVALWTDARLLLHHVEVALAEACKSQVEGCPDEHDPIEDWAAWYVRCADHVDAMTPVQAAGLRNTTLDQHVAKLLQAQAQHLPPVPTYLGPCVAGVESVDDAHVRLRTRRGLDHITLPRTIFQLLSRLDGRTPWPEALEQANHHVEAPFDADLIETLFRRGLLEPRDPKAPDPPPGMSMVQPVDAPELEIVKLP